MALLWIYGLGYTKSLVQLTIVRTALTILVAIGITGIHTRRTVLFCIITGRIILTYTCTYNRWTVTNVELEDRSFSAIRYWVRLAAVAAAITFILLVVLTHIALDRSIVASALAGIIVFSGLFFRSFGKDKEKYDERIFKSI